MVNTEIFQVFHNQTKQEENLASIPEQLQNYVQTQIVEPAQAYYGESLQQHLSGLTPNISEVHSTVLRALSTHDRSMYAGPS